MKVFAQTDIGRIRPINEDSYYLPMEGERFCAVADGMGGHNAGEVASAAAVEVFSETMRKNHISASSLRHAVEKANAAVYSRSLNARELSGMGTTFTALAQSGNTVHIAHVGDSRAYLLRNDTIMRLTIDHTLVEDMVMRGVITAREAKYHPKRNIITRALGTNDTVDVDMIQIELEKGDVFFLCTDGFSNYAEDQEILEISRRSLSWKEKLRALVALALERGGSDNITAMYAVFEEGIL